MSLQAIAWRLGHGEDRVGPWTAAHVIDWPEHADLDDESGQWPTTFCGVKWPDVDSGRWAAEGGLYAITDVPPTCRRCMRMYTQ